MKQDPRVQMDPVTSMEQLKIVQKYEDAVKYLYPVVRSIDRGNAVVRTLLLEALVGEPRLFIEAAKSSQISKLYAADAGLATLRWLLRFAASQALISPKNLRVAGEHLAEVGSMLGAWIAGHKKG